MVGESILKRLISRLKFFDSRFNPHVETHFLDRALSATPIADLALITLLIASRRLLGGLLLGLVALGPGR